MDVDICPLKIFIEFNLLQTSFSIQKDCLINLNRNQLY